MNTYYGILTQIGAAKEATAHALGIPLKITEMAVGDGAGEVPTPTATQTALVAQQRRALLNRLFVDPNNPNWIVAEQVIPEYTGGWWIREIGLYDEAGDLVAVANCPPTYKPLLAEGSGRTQVIRMVLLVTSAANFTLKIDPAVVLATRSYVDEGLSTKAALVHTHPWTDITDKPTSFVPAAHTHPWGDITNKPATSTRWPTWGEVTGKPASFGAPIHSITALPTSNVGPIIVAEASEVWVWVSTAHYTGYRSPLCGRPVDGHTLLPLAHEIDAVGGLLSKTAYAGLWGYAQENELLVTQTAWSANIGAHWFVNVSATQFRVPDLRNQFRRYAGANADNANSRAMGSLQKDAQQNITGGFYLAEMSSAVYPSGAFAETSIPKPSTFRVSGAGYSSTVSFNASRVARTSSETRPVNTAYHPRIHI